MNDKHTKLKKSIFLILICISLTTTFVVSTSAEYYPDRYIEIYLDDGSGNISLFYRSLLYNSYQYFIFDYIADASLVDPSLSGPFTFFNVSSADGNYPDFDQTDPFVFYKIDSIFINDIEYFIDYVPVSGDFGDYYHGYFVYEIPDSGDVIVLIPSDSSSSSPSFLDRVTSGLTSSLSWVGQVVESLTTGPIKPLLECFAVTISVSALLLGIYSIRRFIWGS